MDAQEVLGDVSQILSDREKDYNHYEDMLILISEYWSTYLTSVLDEPVEISGSEVATMMALFKIARSSVGGGEKTADDIKDALGYMAMSSAVRVWEAEDLPGSPPSSRPVTETRLENSPDWGRTEETFENVIRSLTEHNDKWDAGWKVRREH